MKKCIPGKVRFFTCLVTMLIMSTAWSQPVHPEGNWFLQDNTNEWVIGFYDKLVYFRNDFWQYKVVAKKENDILFLLQKEKKRVMLPVSIISDSTIKLTYNATDLLLTNKRRRMAAWGHDEMWPSQKNGKDSVFIKGYVDHRQLTSLKLIEFTVSNLILGNTVIQNVAVDVNGQFKVRLPLQYPSSLIAIRFGGVFEYVYMQPGDTAIVYIDLLPYVNAKSDDAIRTTNCNMVIAGSLGAFNNEYRDYRWHVKRWDDYKERAKMIRESDQDTYKKYELGKKRLADSLAASYQAQFMMSNLLWKTVQATNKYRLANSLYRYRWLHEPDKEVRLSAAYLNLPDSYTANDNDAHLAGSELDGFTREVLNRVVTEHLLNREKTDSFVAANTCLNRYLEYVQEHDKSLTEELIQRIDSLKNSGASLTSSMGSFSIHFPPKDSAATKKVMQYYYPLMQYLDKNDYWIYYYSDIELLHGLSKIDSLFPKDIFRDYLIGHYLYAYFLKPGRLNPGNDVLNKLKTICSDPITYSILLKAGLERKRQFETEKYEDLVSTAPLHARETVINSVARENKGRVIYIDIWATWCGPCIEQFPYSKALKAHFEAAPVAFVYLCADSDKNKWQSSIKKYGLGGQHFLLTTNEISRLRAKYNFSAYPHYMIINKEGKLVTSDGLRPQNKEALISIVEDLLK